MLVLILTAVAIVGCWAFMWWKLRHDKLRMQEAAKRYEERQKKENS